MNKQQFGGPWTEQKLNALEKYLRAYLTIFTANERAKNFTRHYVDAFAGSGYRSVRESNITLPPFEKEVANEALEYMDGSVRKVLSMENDFHHYWFVEKNPNHAKTLKQMIGKDFQERSKSCFVSNYDANEFLIMWASELKDMDRAVVFLDPYGMSVQWATIEKLAHTQKVDLWMLFPSSSVIRMLPNAGLPSEAWSRRLTEFFGDESWLDEFYQEESIQDLFGEREILQRKVSEDTVSRYLLRRLKEIFVGVVKRPLELKNSRDKTLYMLVFAAGNPKGAKPAIKIADSIIKNT